MPESYKVASILYVEDDSDTREMLTVLLQPEGYAVTGVQTGTDALALAESQKFDLFLIDNRLSDITGLELCRRLRQVNATTPIVFFSGAAQDTEKQAARECGAQGYLVKPAGVSEVAAEIARVLNGQRE